MSGDWKDFILENTAMQAPPHVPELRLHLADEAHELWLKTEEELETFGLEPPFWAFAWAGGQGLARFILDNPHHVRGQHIVDIASGSGIVAIAAALAGAASVTANDIDPVCADAIALNGILNDVSITYAHGDMPVDVLAAHDVILAGDVFYDRAMAAMMAQRFTTLKSKAKTILIGDPGRYYLPKKRLQDLTSYQVPVTRALEDADIRRTTIWRFIEG